MTLLVENETLTCTHCGEVKDISLFRLVMQTRNGRTSTYRKRKCITCQAKYTLEWRRNNPEKVREYNLRHNPITGMSVEEYEQRLVDQNGLCKICLRPETRMGSGGKPKRLSVDHNHTTGQKRDLLCDDCNNLIGRAHEDPERLRAAAAYLERW